MLESYLSVVTDLGEGGGADFPYSHSLALTKCKQLLLWPLLGKKLTAVQIPSISPA